MSGIPPSSGSELTAWCRALKQGSESAWRDLHDEMCDEFLRFARSRGVREDDLADLLQRFYLRLLKRMKAFDRIDDFRGWCFCLLRSEIIDSARHAQRRERWTDCFREWFRPSLITGVRVELLEGMREEERLLLERHYVEGWSQTELAGEAGISRKAMESKLARLRLKARRLLQSQEEHE